MKNRYTLPPTDIINTYIEGVDPKFKGIIKKLNEIIIRPGNNFNIAIKWDQLTIALNNDFHHWLFAINQTKNYVSLVFHYGSMLNDSSGIFKTGSSNFLRQILIKDLNEIKDNIPIDLIEQSIIKLPEFIQIIKVKMTKN